MGELSTQDAATATLRVIQEVKGVAQTNATGYVPDTGIGMGTNTDNSDTGIPAMTDITSDRGHHRGQPEAPFTEQCGAP
ncbi:hypothetical protein [Streptomyces sp. NPDC005953]|uniref:hypothetical protein n=1 Tax=unclassified Streptomyces TaxID=2593676 RepID=UPI0033C55E63